MPKVPIKKKYTAVGAYVFAGGFTVGVKSAGFDVQCHLEGDKYGVSTFKLNYPDIPVHVGPENWPPGIADNIDFLYGNPPCAAWSVNNPNAAKESGMGWKTDPRVNCTKTFFNLMLKSKPKVWAWESVCLAPVRGKTFVDDLAEQAMNAGYSVSFLFHDARYLGCPQIRKRWFMVCHRIEFTPIIPNFEKVITVGQSLAGIKPRGVEASDGNHNKKLFGHCLAKIKPGQRLRSYFDSVICPIDQRILKENGQIKGRPAASHVKLALDKVAPATVGFAMAHPVHPRFMTINEVQAIAGFPQWFDLDTYAGKTGSAGLDLIARGVCPPVGAWLARSVKASLDKNIKVKKPVARVYDFRAKGIPVTINGV